MCSCCSACPCYAACARAVLCVRAILHVLVLFCMSMPCCVCSCCPAWPRSHVPYVECALLTAATDKARRPAQGSGAPLHPTTCSWLTPACLLTVISCAGLLTPTARKPLTCRCAARSAVPVLIPPPLPLGRAPPTPTSPLPTTPSPPKSVLPCGCGCWGTEVQGMAGGLLRGAGAGLAARVGASGGALGRNIVAPSA